MRNAFNMNFGIGADSGVRSAAQLLLRWLIRRAQTARSAMLLASLILVLSRIVGGSTAFAAEDAPLDFQVKAAFLVNFAKYVDWPSATFAETNSPITVAIFGDDNVAGEFENMIAGGRAVAGHPLRLKRINKEDQITPDCQILFIASSERQRAQAILEKIKGTSILTVGENDAFLDQGGIVNLVHRDRKIRLQINLNTARQANLKISTRLLITADAVKGKAE
jgi:hypothetical protein